MFTSGQQTTYRTWTERKEQNQAQHKRPSSTRGDEELRAIGVGARIGHGQLARTSMLNFKIFIVELVAIDGLAAAAIARSKVATLPGPPHSQANIVMKKYRCSDSSNLSAKCAVESEPLLHVSPHGRLVSRRTPPTPFCFSDHPDKYPVPA